MTLRSAVLGVLLPVLWLGAGEVRADDPLRLADEAQHTTRTTVVQADSLACGEPTAWGPWPARGDSNSVRLENRPMPLWEKTVLVPHYVLGLPFRLVHYTTEATLTTIDDLGWFELPPIDPRGLQLPGEVYVLPSFSVSGLEGVTYGVGFTRPHVFGTENLAYLKLASSSRKAETLAGGAFFQLTDRLDLELGGGYAEMAKMLYFGLGPFSLEADRSYYERDAHWGGAELEFDLGRGFRTDLLAFFSKVETEETPEEPHLSLPVVHEGRVPYGFPGESNGWTARLGLLRDTTDQTGRPSSGSFHQVSLGYFRSSDRGAVEFLRFHANAEHFFPLWHSDRTLALRGFYNRIENEGDEELPFGRMVTFSSPDELRGYRSMRYYGMGSVGASAEYRWPIWVRHRRASTGVDAYLFTDAGQVFARRQEITLPHFEITGGFGLRLIGSDGGFVGLFEIGVSDEEPIISLSLGQNFQHDRRSLLYGKDPTRKR